MCPTKKLSVLVLGSSLMASLAFSGIRPKHSPTLANAKSMAASTQKAAVQSDDEVFFFIDQGYIFQQNSKEEGVISLNSPPLIRSILLYKDQLLFALQRGGNVYVYHEHHQHWKKIHSGVQKILATETDLVALNTIGKLLIYRGILKNGQVFYTKDMVPTMARELVPLFEQHTKEGISHAFLEASVAKVADIICAVDDNGRKTIRVQYQDGREVDYSKLHISFDDLGVAFEKSIDIDGWITCDINGNGYPITHLSVKKKMGDLYATVQYQIGGAILFNISPAYTVSMGSLIPAAINYHIDHYDRSTPLHIDNTHRIRDIFSEAIAPLSGGIWKLGRCE